MARAGIPSELAKGGRSSQIHQSSAGGPERYHPKRGRRASIRSKREWVAHRLKAPLIETLIHQHVLAVKHQVGAGAAGRWRYISNIGIVGKNLVACRFIQSRQVYA